MAWTIQGGVNNGYPHNENTLYSTPGLTAPYPEGMWLISYGVNDGYPYKNGVSLCSPGLHAPLLEDFR